MRIRKVKGGKTLGQHIVRKFCSRGMYFLRLSCMWIAKLHAIKVAAAYTCCPHPATPRQCSPEQVEFLEYSFSCGRICFL